MKSKQIFFILFACVFIAAAGSVFAYRQYLAKKYTRQKNVEAAMRAAQWHALKEALRAEIAKFDGDAGVVIKDLGTGLDFSFQENELFASASLAKVPLMAACFLAHEQGKIRLDRKIALRSSDKLTGSGLLKDLPAGSAYSIENLIGLMIYDSDNTATNILTNAAGIDFLNESFKSFGLKDTALSRKIADYRLRDKGIENYTTAAEMASLFEKIYFGGLVSKDISDRCIRVLKLSRFNDRIPKYLPPDVTVAHKTGLERGVCHDAGIVFTRKGDFVIVVLTGHSHKTSSPAKEFIAKAALLAYNYFDGL